MHSVVKKYFGYLATMNIGEMEGHLTYQPSKQNIKTTIYENQQKLKNPG